MISLNRTISMSKRLFSTAALGLLVFIVVTLFACSDNGDNNNENPTAVNLNQKETEPNNSLATANNIGLGKIYGNLNVEMDKKDYFVFDVISGGTFRFTANTAGSADSINLRLKDTSDTTIILTEGGASETLTQSLDSGMSVMVRIRADAFGSDNSDGQYNIEIVNISSNDDGTTGGSGPSKADVVAYARANVVGAWGYIGTNCSSAETSGNYNKIYTFFCPGGKMKGLEVVTGSGAFNNGTSEFLAQGSWNVTETPNDPSFGSISLDYTTSIVIGGVKDSGPGSLGYRPGVMIYNPDQDLIAYKWGSCTMFAGRLLDGDAKNMSDEYCSPASSNVGGQCGADADCGRCYYCENNAGGNICRYGGEGPNGCYRGWEPPQ